MKGGILSSKKVSKKVKSLDCAIVIMTHEESSDKTNRIFIIAQICNST